MYGSTHLSAQARAGGASARGQAGLQLVLAAEGRGGPCRRLMLLLCARYFQSRPVRLGRGRRRAGTQPTYELEALQRPSRPVMPLARSPRAPIESGGACATKTCAAARACDRHHCHHVHVLPAPLHCRCIVHHIIACLLLANAWRRGRPSALLRCTSKHNATPCPFMPRPSRTPCVL